MKKSISIFSLWVLVAVGLATFLPACRTHESTSGDGGSAEVEKTAQDYFKSGNLLLEEKKYSEALVEFNKSVELDTTVGDVYANRGLVKYYLKDMEGSLKDYDKAIKLIPNFGEAYDMRGIVKLELNDKEGACKDWENAYSYGFKNAYELMKKHCKID